MNGLIRRPVRIGNASGFYGDRLTAMRDLVNGADIDVITGDYLAELTMLILWKARRKHPEDGSARTFLTQFEEVATACATPGIKVVVNAPPPTFKVAMNYIGGYRNTMTMAITGLNVADKASWQSMS